MSTSTSLEISIPNTSTSTTSSKPFTIYNVSIRQPVRSYELQKRYSDFLALHKSLVSQSKNKQDPPAPLPQKSWFKSTISNPQMVEERRQGLEAYLKAIQGSPDGQWRDTAAWRSFLSLPAPLRTSPSSSSTNTQDGGAAPSTPINNNPSAAKDPRNGEAMDPAVWLNIHRDLKSQLNSARQSLRKRDSASSALGQHEASADAKRSLVKAGTTISTLEQSLVRMGQERENALRKREERNKRKKRTEKEDMGGFDNSVLGEGEIRRRRDLLSAAKKERDGLERQLNTPLVRRNSNSSAASSMATQTTSSNLDDPNRNAALSPFNPQLQTQTQAQAQSSSSSIHSAPPASTHRGRVLGAPLKPETDSTKSLSNDGVLQLQQQIMKEQDEDVTDLTKTVKRMRELGVQINEELATQEEMLDVLDGDVERVGDKVNVAKKRIGKIK